MRLSIRFILVALGVVVAACQAAPGESASAPTLPAATTSATSTPAASMTPSAEATASAARSAAAPGGLDDWTAAQLFLLSGVSRPIRSTCEAALDLPPEATAGIQCRPAGITAIGFYLFESAEAMRETYFARLAEFGVERESGDVCRDGEPGEGIDMPGNEGFEYRIGCYVDGDGIAQVRAALPAVAEFHSVYIGAAGVDGSISDLLLTLFGPREGVVGCNFCAGWLWSVARAE